MVSVYPIPPPDQGFSRFHDYRADENPINLPGMDYDAKLMDEPLGVDDPSKKIRKPYTITKSRESWTEQEHDKFVEALHLFDRDWKKIEAFIGSKSVIQIRSHAQKYFLKVQKNGTSEHVPPPRPKRKAAHPYPHKAPKNVVSQATGSLQSSANLVESGYAATPDSSVSRNQIVGAPLPWTYTVTPPGCLTHMPQEDVGLVSVTNNYSSSSNESASQIWAFNEPHHKAKATRCNTRRVMPDFAQVYSFIGSVFDPTASDHMQRLRKMDLINVDTVVQLMKNLAANLSSPEFENHRKLLSTYNPIIDNKGMPPSPCY